ncbi:MAG TPA: hypothetical protein VH678_02490 [Xanthobacteraceae bacterium]
MRFVRQVWIVLTVLTSSGALAQQVAPIPVTPTPLISSQSSTACLVGCDTQVMNCQNACVVVGPTTGVVNPPGNSPCTLNCTTQQLVCKQACTRLQQ